VAISKANFNSFNVTPTASKFITFNSSNNGLAADDVGGNLKLLSTQTASSSATISFTSGIDSTYKEYIFKFINIHPETNTTKLQINASADTGSNYNVTKTTTYFQAYHTESDSATALQYYANRDLAQSTSAQQLKDIGNTSDDSAAGTLHLFNPSSTTFVKHFFSTFTGPTGESTQNLHNSFVGGYFNTTSAIDAIQFSMSSGNIDSGVIKMYGVL
tara:strand:- start:1288 stop:1935 length:648 start_codon:yes stop_codon:yes gene_type:complete